MSNIQVFISCSHNDITITEELARYLERVGLICWYAPRDIEPGADWATSIVSAIQEAPYFVLIFSDSSNESDQVYNEVVMACKTSEVKHTVINFRISNAEVSGPLSYYIDRNQWVDATEDPDRAYITLARQIREGLGMYSMDTIDTFVQTSYESLVETCCCMSSVEETSYESSAETCFRLKEVEFSAIAPKIILRGTYTLIKVVMYEKAFRYVVDHMIDDSDESLQESRSGIFRVKENSWIKIVLSSPDIILEDDNETGIWQGEYLNFSFAFFLPEQYERQQILFYASVYVNDLIATRLKFIVKCRSSLEQKIEVTRDDVFSAFMSYASQDRNRVAAIVQGMRKARPDMDIFFDVESLRSGDNWEPALYHEIENRDILFLCWSRYARESEWVGVEWRYALKNKGEESIEPIPIDPPDLCPPPKELEHKHFNDKLLYIIRAE